jgi:FtsP/CotA-like multicopper oxidase with cupredoxin domain
MLVAAACSSDGGEGGGEGTSAVAGPVTVDVSLTDFALAPDMIEAPSGQDMAFNVSNDGQAPHSFAVDTGSGVLKTADLNAGETATLEVPALADGDYKIYCTIPGHEDLGMVGSLMVSADAAPTEASGTAAGATGATGAVGPPTMSHEGITVEQMLEGHKAGVEAFPAKTQGLGGQPLKPKMENGVKVFELTATELKWETEPGVFVDAMAYNGQVPGPELRVNPGDKVRIVVKNEMTQPTIMHFHGLTVPNAMDGVPYITQDPILPGGFFTYEFTIVDEPGFFVYHSHFNSTEQVGKGLYGALIVEPKGGFEYQGQEPDVEYTMFLGDGPTGYVLNGKGFPATQPIVASLHDTVLIHLANDGALIHPMHLHGYHFEVIAQDGGVLPEPYTADTLMVAPGQRFDIVVQADYPGVWAYHCHILPHVEGPEGMFGMVTALVVQ